ncbi:MAG: GGDEF domain-containing protein, partial [Burkholderiales bacterium]|nr:GGDEF domain-containing protein [Burkholderiales bacterium]
MAVAEPQTPAQTAKAALRRLALAKLEPTPENYAKAWAEECGEAAGTLPPRARGLMERLAARACEDPAARTELGRALGRSQWDEALRLLDRQGDSALSQARAWAQLVERLTRGLERGGRHWTVARKKDSLQRVLDSSSSDSARLQHRLSQLVGAWDSDEPLPVEAGDDAASATAPADAVPAPPPGPARADALGIDEWPRLVEPLHGALLVA